MLDSRRSAPPVLDIRRSAPPVLDIRRSAPPVLDIRRSAPPGPRKDERILDSRRSPPPGIMYPPPPPPPPEKRRPRSQSPERPFEKKPRVSYPPRVEREKTLAFGNKHGTRYTMRTDLSMSLMEWMMSRAEDEGRCNVIDFRKLTLPKMKTYIEQSIMKIGLPDVVACIKIMHHMEREKIAWVQQHGEAVLQNAWESSRSAHKV